MQDFYHEFSAGAFDLIISDECHRSIYNKWEAVLTYFDATLLGLTATPSDFLDRNTFEFFGCLDQVPTFAYEYEQAVADGYLVPFEAYHARTTIQIEGIHGTELPPDIRQGLVDQGIAPEDLDFAGTDLERKVTNTETTRLLVREFFENALLESGSNLPGKSIIFAMSHKHAKRLWETFNEEYPQFPGIAEIIDSHMEDTAGILDRFKRQSLPRIAISVDMLDAGVDVPTIVNLGFLKPVFSKIKFWQMIGRGTRKVDHDAAKPWCAAGSKIAFRILDFWENFERFQLNPEGASPVSATPVAVRRFRALVTAARRAAGIGRTDLAASFIAQARQMIADLPVESAGVREERGLVETVSNDQFWLTLDDRKYSLLALEVARLMRYLGGVDLAALTFDVHCLDCLIGHLTRDEAASARHAGAIRDDLTHLPIDHPGLVSLRASLIYRHGEEWVEHTSIDEILELRSVFGPLMHLREPEPSHIITLNLTDAFKEQRWVVVGPKAQEFDAEVYRKEVETRVRQLAESHPAVLKLATGAPLGPHDLTAIEEAVNQPDLYITVDSLRAAYLAPHGSLVSLLRHALGTEPLASREDAIRDAFEVFIADKGYLGADQLMFIRLFARRLIEAGRLDRADLYEEPFLRLGFDVDTRLPENDIDALLSLAAKYEAA